MVKVSVDHRLIFFLLSTLKMALHCRPAHCLYHQTKFPLRRDSVFCIHNKDIISVVGVVKFHHNVHIINLFYLYFIFHKDFSLYRCGLESAYTSSQAPIMQVSSHLRFQWNNRHSADLLKLSALTAVTTQQSANSVSQG